VSTRWRILDLAHHNGLITTRRGRLTINNIDIPLADISCIITGHTTTWDEGFIPLITKFEIPTVICDWRNIPTAIITPWSTNTRIGARQHAQAALTQPRKKNAWMRITRSKIVGQANNLRHQPAQRAKLLQIAKTVRSGDPTNTEATAARIYWAHLFDTESFTRDTSGHGRNTLLNYGYTILRGSVIRAIVTTGLTPTLGIWHHNRSNTFALADDLIEPFRPAIDHAVTIFPATTHLRDSGVRAHLVATLTQPIDKTGETLNSAITSFTQHYANYVEGDVTTLNVPSWSPPGG